jgi:dTDP-4-dehydrorhamnose 3,5-epimerase
MTRANAAERIADRAAGQRVVVILPRYGSVRSLARKTSQNGPNLRPRTAMALARSDPGVRCRLTETSRRDILVRLERLETRLDGPVLIRPVVRRDQRGFFQETYRRNACEALGIRDEFVQDNHSRSVQGVVRGMHFQVGDGVAKLVRCARGVIFDVIVDIRRGSPTFGEWEAFELTDENHHQIYCPIGFAHGFCVLSEQADVMYKQTAYYDAALERGISYDDPDVAIAWPEGINLRPSERDANAPRLREIHADLPFVYKGPTAV